MADFLKVLGTVALKGVDIPSASILVIPTAVKRAHITGSEDVDAFDTEEKGVGQEIWLTFENAITLTDGATLDLGGANVTTETGKDYLFVVTAENEVRRVALGGGAGGLTVNRLKTLTFTDAPAATEFGIPIGAGTDEVVLNGAMDAAAIQAALETSDDLTGYTVEVKGSSSTDSTGTDGVALYSGSFHVFLTGPEPYPSWRAVKDAEVQSFTVTQGDDGNYTLNGGAAFTLGITEADLQANQRALGDDYAAVVVKGESEAPSEGSNQLTGGTAFVEASGHGPISSAENAFDGAWGYTADDLCYLEDAGVSRYPYAIGYDKGSGNGFVAIKLRLRGGYIAEWNDSHPKDFILQASNDGTTWDDLLTVTDAVLPVGDWAEWDVANTTIYRYYRLYVTASQSGGNNGRVTEIELYSAAAGVAHFHSYFPRLVGDVAAPAATGTDHAVATVHEGDSESEVVEESNADLAELVWAGL